MKGRNLPSVSALTAASATALALLILGPQQLPSIAAAAVPSFAAAGALELRMRRKVSCAMEEEALLIALHSLHSDLRHGKRSMFRSVADLSAGAAHREGRGVSGLFSEMGMRLALGQDFDESARSSRRLDGSAANAVVRDISSAYSAGFDLASAVGNAHSQLAAKRSDEFSSHLVSVQRHASLSMMTGTILPSFLVFAFVGYSIVHYSQSMFTLFTIALLIILPSAYAAVRMGMAGMHVS